MALLEKLINLVAPDVCLFCKREGKIVCDWCAPDFIEPLPSRCYGCRTVTFNFEVCKKCRRRTVLRNVWVSCDYSGKAKKLIHAFKYERAQSAAKPIAAAILEILPALTDNFVITYIPTATSRQRLRGYDHAGLVAREISKQTGMPIVRLLARIGQSRQVGSKREVRKLQAEGMFRPVSEYLIKGRQILLIDDIVTTGATLESAAQILRQNGAKKVYAAVFAQKQ